MLDSSRSKLKVSILGNSDLDILFDEDRMIEDAITTPYERVLKILTNTKNFMSELTTKIKFKDSLSQRAKEMVNDMEWVIKRIQSHSLYTYEFSGETEDLEKYSEENSEIKSFLEFLNDYSEAKDLKRRNKIETVSHSTKCNHKVLQGFSEYLKAAGESSSVNKRGTTFLSKLSDGELLEIEIGKPDDNPPRRMSNGSSSTGNKSLSKSKFFKEENNAIIEKSHTILEKISDPDTNKVFVKEDVQAVKKRSNKLIGHNRLSMDFRIQTSANNSSKDLPVVPDNICKTPKSKFKESKLSIGSIRKNLVGEDKKQMKDQKNQLNFITINKMNPFKDYIKKEGQEAKFNSGISIHVVPSEPVPVVEPPQHFNVEPKQILSRDFNIHDFDSDVGRRNVLPLIGKTIFKALELMELINSAKLDNFLTKISAGYIEKVKYHNSIHAADVSLTIATWFLNSNLEEITIMRNNDVLAMICAALGHDIGHPGTNNGYQVNTYSEIALTYNDQSVLENFHCSLFFKICKSADCNIFDKMPENEYRQLRKRIINLILATDMMQHAKVITMIKPRVTSYKESRSKLADKNEVIPFISTGSNLIFDEQQKVMDFIMHSADLSHNSKKFRVSKRWTDLLSDEFWHQGDSEKYANLPLSFLCDRATADVPKSQIGFIRGIVSPTFDVLVELLPTLSYLKQDIENNLDEWSKINEMKRLMTPKITRTPMMIPRMGANSPRHQNQSIKKKLELMPTFTNPTVNQKKNDIFKIEVTPSSPNLNCNK